MALLLCLGLTASLARGCLHCHGNFSDKFTFYRHHVNLKSWWVGDIPVSGSLLTDWSQATMKELHLAIPAEITREKLDQVANTVYQRMDQLYQGKMYFPGRIDCQRHCGEWVGTRAGGGSGRGGCLGSRSPRLLCCRHFPLQDHLMHELHRFPRGLFRLQLRVLDTVGESCAGSPPVHK
ncbi:izumo sperm-egg fusion protein 4 isoform X1 [Sorex fumeus]|uniref:izumo sperm-egg fusion protein 4 isoform X1 n=1 Tax=Sorex fumeus TaxID=62283 RepID=UPI0024ADE472|nr:izumo sperm-egg fusion protein 4 isoform X1 [Sorex fumeus]